MYSNSNSAIFKNDMRKQKMYDIEIHCLKLLLFIIM